MEWLPRVGVEERIVVVVVENGERRVILTLGCSCFRVFIFRSCGCSSHAHPTHACLFPRCILIGSRSTTLQLLHNRGGVLFRRGITSQVPSDSFSLGNRLQYVRWGSTNIHPHMTREKNKYKHTERVAFSILSACSLRFMCLSIISEDNKRAVGLAKPLPNKKKYC